MQRKIGNITLEILLGNIVEQKGIDAVVNAANAYLRSGGGVAGAIHRAAGAELEKATRPLAPIKPGEAVLTPGFNLPNPYIIHCLGPVYGVDEPADKLLANCFINALQLAEEKKISSIAFPAISTGAFGYPMEEAARVSLKAIIDKSKDLHYVKLVRIVLADQKALEIFESALKELLNNNN